jgi:hypothetical protein
MDFICKVINNNSRWCVEQSEAGNLLNIPNLGTMYYVQDKTYEGISIVLTEAFIKTNELKLDENRFSYKNLSMMRIDSNVNVVKLNLLNISSELTLQKIYVHTGLNKIFSSIGALMSSVTSCVIDLGHLGVLHAYSKLVYHVPSKLKRDTIFNKRTTVKALCANNVEESKPKESETKKTKKKNDASVDKINITEESIIPNKTNILLHKLKTSIRKIDDQYNEVLVNKSVKKLIDNDESKQTLVPLRDNIWTLKDMINTTFKRSDNSKSESVPALFNVYCNTKAAPFTSEKTQIPITHRIASFYSISIQNLIIDKTSKNIKRLYDEYFYKYKNIKFEQPATEQEEYQALFDHSFPKEKVELRKESFARYVNYIFNYVEDEYISDIKEKWLINIVKKCLRAYNINNQEKYNTLLNDCVREIIILYKVSMKTSIIDYMLKHPEQRLKLMIPVGFRKIKEYGEQEVSRPSDNKKDWKRRFISSKLKIANSLMIVNNNIVKINKYYNSKNKKSSFFELSDNWHTVGLNVFMEIQKSKIENQINFIREIWKKEIGKIIKQIRLPRDQLDIYFRSVSCVMSTQLRKMIIDSLRSYHDFLVLFKKDKYPTPRAVFENQLHPRFPFERSFLEVDIIFENKVLAYSYSLEDINEKLLSLLSIIVEASRGIEKVDNVFDKDRRGYLWQLDMYDKEVDKYVRDIEDILEENRRNNQKVLELYEPFEFVLSENERLESFKLESPSREQIREKITFYEQRLNMLIEEMPNIIYMNMILINCKDINQKLKSLLEKYIADLLSYVLKENILHKAKLINETNDIIIDKLSKEVKDDPVQVVNFENELDTMKTETLITLSHDYEDFIEWVFFYYSYDLYEMINDQSLENSIKTTHSNIKLIQPKVDNFEHNLKTKKNEFEIHLGKEKASILQTITDIRKRVDEYKANSANSGLDDNSFLLILKQLEQTINETQTKLEDLVYKEELLGLFPTDDERLELCRVDLKPLIIFFNFQVEFRDIRAEKYNIELKHLDFLLLIQFMVKSNEIFEVYAPKLTSLKPQINRSKRDFESFKDVVELGKTISTLIDIYKFETGVDNYSLIEENKVYCIELTKIIYEHEKGYETLKNLKLTNLQGKKEFIERFKKSRTEIDKIIQEWETVKSCYNSMSTIAGECEISFKTENYKDKKYIVISHSNYEFIKNSLSGNIKSLNDSLKIAIDFKFSVKSKSLMENLNENLTELYNIVNNMNNIQIDLEKLMSKSAIIHRNNEAFYKLKQAEQIFKSLIDNVIERPQVMELLRVKEFFVETLETLTKTIGEIPHPDHL